MSDETPDDTNRIAKVLARAGVCSRRAAEKLIAEGRVAVNGVVLHTPAVLVGPGDEVSVDGAPLKPPEHTRLWRYHKPPGLVTTHHDPQGRPTVFERLPRELPRVVSVGRLDLNSEGLLLLTNNGELAGILERPATGWPRRYRVRVHGLVTQAKLDRLAEGVTVDGISYGPITAELERQQGSNAWVLITLLEGKNREVRRVMEFLGYTVNRLIRISYGPFHLGRLDRGVLEEVPPSIVRDQLEGLDKSLTDSLPRDVRRDKTNISRWAKAKPRPHKPGQKAARKRFLADKAKSPDAKKS